MSDRFFSSVPVTADHVTLDGPEAHHLLHVMRAAPGASLTIFDDSGAEFEAIVESVRRSEATLRIVERREVDRELPRSLTLGVALPKGDRQKWLVEKLTELGATELVPLITERGVAQPNAAAIERLSRSVIEAAKQCGRNRLMNIAKPLDWSSWLQSASSTEATRLVAHPNGSRPTELKLKDRGELLLAIGPEGGFTDAEIAEATAAGWELVSLGTRVLRVETAAIALAAACTMS
jgi:16S rRNA (uracil1498-N3)-methyltransferase